MYRTIPRYACGFSISYVAYNNVYRFYNPIPPPDTINKSVVAAHFGGKAETEIREREKQIKILSEKAGIKNIKIYYNNVLNDG